MNESWLDCPVLVTGATGFLGSWLTRELVQRGAEVVCLVRDWIPEANAGPTIVRGCITDASLLERILGEYEIDTVFHLAAQTVVGVANANPISTFDTNIAGAWTLLEACRRSPKVRAIVAASSDKAYGPQPSLPYTEDTPLAATHPYDVSKACADIIAQAYAATYDLPLAITRCGNFFGGGDRNWNRLVPGTIRSVLRGERPIIRSDGRFQRDYLYIEDAVAAYLLLAAKLRHDPTLQGRAYNFSNQSSIGVLELVSMVLRLMHSGLAPDIRNEASHEIRHQSLSCARAHSELGWRPAFTLEEGLRRTIDWYRRHLTGATNEHRSWELTVAHTRAG